LRRLRDIASLAQLAVLLEVSAPKPGNVTPAKSFSDTTYVHFLASASALWSSALSAARRGWLAGRGRIKAEKVGLGELIKRAVRDTRRLHGGGNTLLGELMLLIPLCAAAGYAAGRSEPLRASSLRRAAGVLINATTPEDAVQLYRAIRLASPRLGRAERLDVFSRESEQELLELGISMKQVLSLSLHDSIARELVLGYPLTFELALPALLEAYSRTGDLLRAAVECYLHVLAEVPDSLIERKAGRAEAEKVSELARQVLASGAGEGELERFDAYLRSRGNLLNPGTTADITGACLFVALLTEVKP